MKEMKEANIEQAIKQGVKAVSCYWIMACDEQKQRLPEVEFPPGFDPKRALNISGTKWMMGILILMYSSRNRNVECISIFQRDLINNQFFRP